MFNKTVAVDYSRFQVRAKILVAGLLMATVAVLAAPKAHAENIGAALASADFIAFMAPVKGFDINSPFGPRRLSYEPRARMHEGVDYPAPTGSAILSAAPGRVLRTGTSTTYGRFVEVQHSNGVTSFYAHMSRVEATQGQVVQQGDEIGKVGSSGRVTGPHLHFEIRRNGEQINPNGFLGREFEVASVIPESTGDAAGPVTQLAGVLTRGMPEAPLPYSAIAGVISGTVAAVRGVSN